MTKSILNILNDNILDKEYLNEIISVFNDINKGIIQLHRFAAEDFTLMRNQFKEYNRKAARISDNGKRAFELINPGNESFGLIGQIDHYYTQLSNYYNKFITKIESSDRFLDELRGNIEKMVIPGKNLNQHISTLNIVLANLRIYKPLKSEAGPSGNNPNLIFDQLKKYYTAFDKGTISILDSLNGGKQKIKSIRLSYFDQLAKVFDNIKTCKEKSLEKHREVSRRIPELSANIQENIGNSNKIIIELQYHDIIRQKIEHIQDAHTNIIKQLTRFNKDDNNTKKTDIVKYLMQVGDIARIQASQLLNVNKEYEMAMDTISEELLSFSDNMISIVDLCNRFSMDKSEPLFCKIEEVIGTNHNLRTKLTDANINVDELYLVLRDEITLIKDNFLKIAELTRQLELSFDNILKQDSYTNKSGKGSKIQASDLFKDIKSSISYLVEQIDNISEAKKRMDSCLPKAPAMNELNEILGTLLEHEQKLLPDINEKKETINSIFKENSEYTRNITDRILTAVRSIKYYDYFDKLAEKIIRELNHISETFYISEAEASRHSIENIKKKYTMKSEREIHDNALMHGKGNVELFNDDKDNGEPDKSNYAELF